MWKMTTIFTQGKNKTLFVITRTAIFGYLRIVMKFCSLVKAQKFSTKRTVTTHIICLTLMG
jgi:hypothetical protein